VTVRPPRIRTFPAISLLSFLLMAPSTGADPLFGVNGQSTGAGRGAQTTPPPNTQGRGQTPPAAGAGAAGQTGQQGPRTPPTAEQYLAGWTWWKDEAVKKEMKLTDKQVQSINRIFEQRVRDITPYNEELQKQLAELDRMAKERKVDVNAYALQVSRTEYLRSELSKTRLIMLYAISKQLSDEQVLQLRDIRDRHRAGRGGNPPAPRVR
jgi:predicted transglutaminase-like cysteine proteinase